MVCLGNICRSPLAEGLLKSKLDSSQFEVDSAGTGAWHVGNPPDPRSIAIADKYDLDISMQRATHFHYSFLDHYDYIFVMDKSNYKDVINLAENEDQIQKVKLILNEINPEKKQDVPDPYYGGADGFEKMYQLLDQATHTIASRLNRK